MKMLDTLRFEGHLTIRVLDAVTRKAKLTYELPNVICVGMLEAVERLMTFYDEIPADGDYGTVAKENRLWAIYTGDDNTAPSYADTALGNLLFKKTCDAIAAATPMQIDVGGTKGLMEVQMTMESDEGGGAPNPVYKEAGLYSRGDKDAVADTSGARLLARRIHPNIEKDSSIAIEYTWRVRLTAA
jgi:hypothetical protein